MNDVLEKHELRNLWVFESGTAMIDVRKIYWCVTRESKFKLSFSGSRYRLHAEGARVVCPD